MAYSSTAVWYFAPSALAFFPNDLSAVGGGSWSLAYAKSSNELVLTTAMDRSSVVAYATMYYTKTS